jgi:hypothetical protein
MGQLAMQPEHIGTFTIIDRLINLATNRSHGKSVVVGANMILKRLADVILSSEQVEKLRRWPLEGWQNYLSTQTAHAKPWIDS